MSTLKLDYLEAGHGTEIAINVGTTILGTASQFKITGGTSGQALITDGSGGLTFALVDALPAQSTQAGKFLTTDGINASWSTVTHPDALPSQTGQAGEFLTTDGTSADWISDVGQIETQGNYYKNYTQITSATTTTIPASENAAVVGQISVAIGIDWSINGTLKVL